MTSVVGAFSVKDVSEGNVQLPFTNKRAWVEVQDECPDLRRVSHYLRNGTSPGRKGRNQRIVKRYISSKVGISSEGTLVVRSVQPLGPAIERIVIPQQVLHGVLTVFHLRLNHPTSYQLSKVVNRYFFALNLDNMATSVTKACSLCSAIKDIPTALIPQSTEDPPEYLGQTYAADVVKRNGQKILILRECSSSYTLANFIDRETAEETSQALLQLCNLVRPSPLCPITIRVDPASAHKSLFTSSVSLKAQNIKLDLGRVHNVNHNPVAEKCIRELIREILILSPEGGKISSSLLSQAVANLNTRIRASGLSSHEVITQRDQASGHQLNIRDETLINEQHRRRVQSHGYSERSKSGNKPRHPVADISAGSVVFLYSDGSKLKARPRYLVISVKDGWCQVKRLSDKQLGSETYPVKLEEMYKVQDEMNIALPVYSPEDLSDDDEVLLFSRGQDKSTIVYPCTVCAKEVEEDHEALQCDDCDKWCHIECGGVSRQEYREHQEEDEESNWSCPAHASELLDKPPERPPDRL
jgi:hypothetical protein